MNDEGKKKLREALTGRKAQLLAMRDCLAKEMGAGSSAIDRELANIEKIALEFCGPLISTASPAEGKDGD